MKLRIVCAKHDDAPVIPAENFFHWDQNPAAVDLWLLTNRQEASAQYYEELDPGSLYCTGKVDDKDRSTWGHEFHVVLEGKMVSWTTGKNEIRMATIRVADLTDTV